MTVQNKVQLITYPDSLGGNLKSLRQVLLEYLPDVFKGGVHILPPFPSSGDRGFAPLTYLEIEPEFGTWEDIRAIGEDFDVLLDLMVNHISRQSVYFKDFLKHGRKSQYADMFITVDKLWADGIPVQQDINLMFLRRLVPYSVFAIEETGEEETVWSTFGKTDPSEQIDLDVYSETTRRILTEFFRNFSKNNVKIVRLDAVGYVIKKLGTSCFFVEPEIYRFLDWLKGMADSFGIELLPEIHSDHVIQFELAKKGFWIYDFVLPYTILDALVNKDSTKLCEYLKIRPEKQFTMLDCHDGIPVKPDLDGLIDNDSTRKLIDLCLDRGSNLSRIVSDMYKSEDGFDVHQIRGTYYSVLNCDDDAYIAARAIQFFTPGIPQVYYTGLLAGENDFEAVNRTGEGRDINRHNYSLDEIKKSIDREVVQRLLELIRFRNDYPAFDGEFKIMDSAKSEIRMSWSKNEKFCNLFVDLNSSRTEINYMDQNGDVIRYIV